MDSTRAQVLEAFARVAEAAGVPAPPPGITGLRLPGCHAASMPYRQRKREAVPWLEISVVRAEVDLDNVWHDFRQAAGHVQIGDVRCVPANRHLR